MYRTDFMKIAQAFKLTRPLTVHTSSVEFRQWEKDLHMIEQVCEIDNPNFNSHKFRAVAYADR